MSATISERLELLIDAKSGGAVTALQATSKSAEQLAVTQDKLVASSTRLTAAADKLSLSEAKLSLSNAKAAGDSDSIAAAQTGVAAAQEKATLSKGEARVAADQLSVSELKAKAATDGLGSSANASSGLMSKLGLSGQSLSGVLETIAPLAAAAAVALEFKLIDSGVKQFEALGLQVQKFEGVAGGTAQQASLLIGQMKVLGVDPDAAAKAFQRLGASIGDGTTKLSQYGVEVAHYKDGTTDVLTTVDNLRKAYNDSADAATRDAIAKQLGLRQATALIPLLKLTDDQIRSINDNTKATGNVFSQADVDNAVALKVASGELKQAFQGFELTLSKGIVPDLVKALDAVVSISKTVEKIPGISKFLEGAASGGVLPAIDSVTGAYDKLTGKKKDSSDADRTAAATASVVEGELTQQAAAVDKLTQSTLGELDAKKAVSDAAQTLSDAQATVITSQDALNKLLADGAVDAKAVATAQQDLAAASRDLQRAEDDETRSQEALSTARQRATALDLADANSKIALAGDKIAQATAAEQTAKEAYDKLLGSGSASAGELATSSADVKTKHDELTQAIIDQGKATVDLGVVKQKGTEADPAVISAEQAVTNAHDTVTGAIDRQRNALDVLHTAEAGDPDYAAKVVAARRAVADAHQAVADAQTNQVRAALALGPATDALNTSLGGSATALQTVLDKLISLKAQGLNVDSLAAQLPGGTAAVNPARPAARQPTGPGPRADSTGILGGLIWPGGIPPARPAVPAAAAAAPAGKAMTVVVQARTGATASEIVKEADWHLNPFGITNINGNV
jgi:hypothetical protein